MYSKIVLGMAVAGAASAANIVRRDTGGGGHHDHSHAPAAAAPSSGYSEPAAAAPAAGYGAPAASYGAPAASYGAPAASYGAPASSYGAPATGPSYSAPSAGYGYDVGYEEEGGFDLSAIIIPILIIFGLSLLFPTITTVSVNGRRKRDLETGMYIDNRMVSGHKPVERTARLSPPNPVCGRIPVGSQTLTRKTPFTKDFYFLPALPLSFIDLALNEIQTTSDDSANEQSIAKGDLTHFVLCF